MDSIVEVITLPKYQKIISILLCIIIIFMCFAAVPFTHAKANPLVLAPEVYELVVFLLIASGVAFTSVAEQNSAAYKIYTDIQSVQDWVTAAKVHVTGVALCLPIALYKQISAVVSDIKKYIGDTKKSLATYTTTGNNYMGAAITYETDGSSMSQYQMATYGVNDTVTVKNITGQSYTYSILTSSSTQYIMQINGVNVAPVQSAVLNINFNSAAVWLSRTKQGAALSMTGYKSVTPRWGLTTYTDSTTGNTYIQPYMAGMVIYNDSSKAAAYCSPIYYPDNSVYYTGAVIVSQALVLPTTAEIDLAVTHAVSYAADEFKSAIDAVASKYKDTDTMDIPLDDVNADVTYGSSSKAADQTAEPSATWEKEWEKLGILDMVKAVTT